MLLPTARAFRRFLVSAVTGGLCLGGCSSIDERPAPTAATPTEIVPGRPTSSVGAATPTASPLVLPDGAGWIDGKCVASTWQDSPEPPPEALVIASRWAEWYGRDGLWAVVDVDNIGTRDRDGRIGMKFGWERLVDGQLVIRAERLDGVGMARAYVPDGYGTSGFQASSVSFSTEGCWLVVGTLGTTELLFVVAVHD
jgi:hypothetical protein